ncbi:unnamed protein product, partial [Brachionus calyciflorus]
DAYLYNQPMNNKTNLNARPLLSTSNINKIYSNSSSANNLNNKSPTQFNILATRNNPTSNRTISIDTLSTQTTTFNQQRPRPYTATNSNTSISDNRSGRIKKETNL